VTAQADKVRARKALNHAIAAGKVIPQPCERCSAPKAQGHHPDYSKPLVVEWLCPKCHSQLHNQKHPLTQRCAVCDGEFTPAPTKRARKLTCSDACHRRREHQQHQRLPLETMRTIYRRVRAGEKATALAAEYGVDRTRISQIGLGKASRIQEVNDAIAA